MRRGLLTAAVIAIVLGVLYLGEARRYAWGSTPQPGPGLYPTLVGLLMLVGAGGVAVEALRSRGGTVDWPGAGARGRVLAILVPAIGYVLLLPALGHLVAGSLLALPVLRAMGQRSWVASAVIAVAIGAGSHYLFAVGLGVPLPAGLWTR